MTFTTVRNSWLATSGLLGLLVATAQAGTAAPSTSAKDLKLPTSQSKALFAVVITTPLHNQPTLNFDSQPWLTPISHLALTPTVKNKQSGYSDPGKPTVEPSKPYTEPSKPTVEPSKPYAEPGKPDVEPGKPEVEQSRPYTEPGKPDVEPEKPVAKPAKPVVKPAKPLPEKDSPEYTSPMGPVTSVSQLSDVRPTDWAFQALQSLVERYGCIVGYPDRTYRGYRALSRYEFAAGLNACMDRINELITAGTADLVKKEDLLVVQKLQEEFAAELATLRGRVDALEARTATLEKQQFSTTTKLVGEAIFAISDLFGSQVDRLNNTVFQDRVRIGLQTSFTGRDVLNTRLAAGNVNQFSVIANPYSPFVLNGNGRQLGTAEGTTSFSINGQTNNSIVVDRLDYTFPLGNRLKLYVAAAGGKSQYYVASTVNPFFDDFDGGNGSISAFSQESPIYRIGGGAGAGLKLALDDKQTFTISAGYLASNANNPSGSNGLFNGDFAALGQLTFSPSDRFQIGLTYVRGYHTSGNSIFSLGLGNNNFFTGTLPANAIHTAFGQAASTNSYGAEASFKLSPKIAISGFGGYTDLQLTGGGNGQIWYYGLGLAFPDLFKKGNLGGIFVGVEPYLGSANIVGLNLRGLGLQNATSLHVEGFYRYQLTDNISITPGVIWITAPDQNSGNSDNVLVTLRTTFSF
ncbi:MAG: iron uptake porin [Leptolyngbya sp. BL-A-14]